MTGQIKLRVRTHNQNPDRQMISAALMPSNVNRKKRNVNFFVQDVSPNSDCFLDIILTKLEPREHTSIYIRGVCDTGKYKGQTVTGTYDYMLHTGEFTTKKLPTPHELGVLAASTCS